MNAGRILRAAGYDTAELRVRIAPVNPDLVNVWPASTRFRRFWRSGIEGVTHGKAVFVDPRVMRGDPDRLARLVVHELIHVRQFVVSGYIAFVASYLRQYWMGRIGGKTPREAYLDVAQEREARELTAQTIAVM